MAFCAPYIWFDAEPVVFLVRHDTLVSKERSWSQEGCLCYIHLSVLGNWWREDGIVALWALVWVSNIILAPLQLFKRTSASCIRVTRGMWCSLFKIFHVPHTYLNYSDQTFVLQDLRIESNWNPKHYKEHQDRDSITTFFEGAKSCWGWQLIQNTSLREVAQTQVNVLWKRKRTGREILCVGMLCWWFTTSRDGEHAVYAWRWTVGVSRIPGCMILYHFSNTHSPFWVTCWHRVQ